MKDKVLDFIKRRFPSDCNWISGNCYYFALILKCRFNGIILYDTINGHFVTKIGESIYDWQGIVNEDCSCYVDWDDFSSYDVCQEKRIIRDCIL